MRTRLGIALTALLAAVTVGCATVPPLNTAGVDKGLTPATPSATLDLARGKRVAWGGIIIDSRNLRDTSQVEVLAYPLDSDGRPETDSKPLGRFLAIKSGYLETLDFSRGRLASFVGTVQPTRAGKVGAAEYRYPVLHIEDSRIWRPRSSYGPQFHFGLGVILN